MLYPVLAMIAAFVINPIGGFLVTMGALGLLAILDVVRPGLVGIATIAQVAFFATLAVIGVWPNASLIAGSWLVYR